MEELRGGVDFGCATSAHRGLNCQGEGLGQQIALIIFRGADPLRDIMFTADTEEPDDCNSVLCVAERFSITVACLVYQSLSLLLP